MADIFVSYARRDRRLVLPIVAALVAQGWSVWWDREIVSAQEFGQLFGDELDAAQAVLLVWTPASTASRWVKGEAREAADRGIRVPVRFHGARLPIDVRSNHTTDFDSWNGDLQSPPGRGMVSMGLRSSIFRLPSTGATGLVHAKPWMSMEL